MHTYALEKYIVHHFADDTSLLFGNKYHSEISCVRNNELQLLSNWLKANKFSLNESKTRILIFSSRRKVNVTVPNIKQNNFILTPENNVIYVGIQIDENLSWNKKIEILSKKLCRTNGILSKLRYHVSKEASAFTTVFFNCIQYRLYSLVLYVTKYMEKVFALQKKCMVLLIFSDYRAYTSPIFESLKVLNLQRFVASSIVKLIYFYFNDQLPLQVKNIFIQNDL